MAAVPSRPLPPGIPADWTAARQLFEEATLGLRCRDLLHVRHDTCTAGCLDMLAGSLIGAAKYFVPFYMVHAIWNGKKALSGGRAFCKEMAYFYARSILFGATMGFTFSVTSCIAVRLTRGFSFWTSVLVPGTCAGLSILLEHNYRRRIVLNTFYNMALHYLYVRAQVARLVRRTASGETIAFMAINGLLLFLLHKAGAATKQAAVFWFFIPEAGKVDPGGRCSTQQQACPVPHDGLCWKSAVQATARYSALAASLQALRVIMSKGTTIVQAPTVFFREFISKKTLAGIMSIGGYVFLYKVVRCALAKRYGFDRCHHSALAGVVAGSAYWLQPNTTVLTSALIATIRLLSDYLPKRAKALAQWPVPELIFALCNGILFHARCMDMAHCPKFIVHMMDSATQNRSKIICDAYLGHVHRLQSIRHN